MGEEASKVMQKRQIAAGDTSAVTKPLDNLKKRCRKDVKYEI